MYPYILPNPIYFIATIKKLHILLAHLLTSSSSPSPSSDPPPLPSQYPYLPPAPQPPLLFGPPGCRCRSLPPAHLSQCDLINSVCCVREEERYRPVVPTSRSP
eukprot:714668-Hanusia_phi.AAC.2